MRNGPGKMYNAKTQKWHDGEWKDDEELDAPKDDGHSPWLNMRKVRNTIQTLPGHSARVSQMPDHEQFENSGFVDH